jgi:D-alanyl-D-alanine carboxypeptidase/D-alanyl-D-alanine-endopeptidase (penicillin-binding protein 4)
VTPAADLASRLTSLRQAAQAKGEVGREVSYCVLDVAADEVLAAHLADVPRRMASVTKLITAVAALMRFGPEHRFRTGVEVHGDSDAGFDVVVRGGGDPDLGAAAMARAADAVVARVAGAARNSPAPDVSVRVDSTLFAPPTPAPGMAPEWDPRDVMPVVPTTLHEYYGTAPDEALGRAFAAALGARGLNATWAPATSSRGRSDRAANPRCEAAVLESAPLVDLVEHMLAISHNSYAEVLARNAAVALGLPGDWAGTAAVLAETLTALGLDRAGLGGIRFVDGSGLAPVGRLRADVVAQLLRLLADPPPEHAASLACLYPGGALPLVDVAGSQVPTFGWFADLPRGRPIWGKTGSVSGVAAFAGLTRGAEGRMRAFSVVANDVPEDGGPWAGRSFIAWFAAAVRDL